MALPKILSDWLADSEQDMSRMSRGNMLAEALLCIGLMEDESCAPMWSDLYSGKDLAMLRAYAAGLEMGGVTPSYDHL